MGGCIAIVVGAGRGHRFGGATPKQYLPLAGAPVVRRALRSFLDHPGVDSVLPVIHPDDRELFAAAASGLEVMAPVSGGATRRESVLLGLESLAFMTPDRVLIHDAARPFVGEEVISGVLKALERYDGAIPALPVSDTLKRAGKGDLISETVDRSGLWRAQTPQGFRFKEIIKAHRAAEGAEFTDDAAVAENFGLTVALVMGSEDNMKITTGDDLLRAERQLGAGESRCGMGLDAHRFKDGDHVMLCGVRIPFASGLEGHSDADVGLHALTDALLGAVGAGDIGDHFPPNDPQWRGAASEIFLKRAGDIAKERGAVITNMDITLICEKPKIGPHRAAMVGRIAGILGMAEERISVKATTTERMGFTGRGEGIAAQAIATVNFPHRCL
ncbi:MAG: bifunctional 2-C-methyl-D-erythritol 4-phosphate cytidylyltransferase/2-C-methyl-D-erythritol 2,4-cyclodiphosphate synthase [Rhodospirillales bacterium RIFCSPLOWO2_02_FULL_58_16]|nr:MAG: bifunctional 2-C-methyl-D-erythritol 4-phosphate cytidylyltransferase/2-C-methyl-D-erythritol 2,4-cyclodiphosphate synthase [Rhodospirillales bacterium RIFCSPLOWO2_02_FULL_58_16]